MDNKILFEGKEHGVPVTVFWGSRPFWMVEIGTEDEHVQIRHDQIEPLIKLLKEAQKAIQKAGG